MEVPAPVKDHPNAVTVAVGTIPVAFIVKLIDMVPWIHLDQTEELLVGGWILSFILFVGKRGLHGCINAIWKGTKKDQTV